MADRKLVEYEEPRNPEGPYWTLEVERSASGEPTLFFTIKNRSFTGDLPEEEKTIIVENADKVLAPAMEWLAAVRAEKEGNRR